MSVDPRIEYQSRLSDRSRRAEAFEQSHSRMGNLRICGKIVVETHSITLRQSPERISLLNYVARSRRRYIRIARESSDDQARLM